MNLSYTYWRKNLFSKIDKFVFFLISAYFFLDNGLLASLVFGFPIGISGQLILIPLMIFYLYKERLKLNLILVLILLWNFYGLIGILFAYQEYGLITLRSSTYITDTNYILIGSLIAQNSLKRVYFQKIFWQLLLVANIYFAMIPLKGILLPLSPKLEAFSGYSVSLLFNYGNSSLISIPFFFSENFFPLNGKKRFSKIIAFLTTIFTFTYTSARYNYFIFFVLSIYSFLRKPKKIYNIILYISIALIIIFAFLSFGIKFTGRGENINSIRYFYDHFLSSFGISSGSIDGQSSGFSLRTSWWNQSLKEVFSSFKNIIFGVGQGRPLTDFYNTDGNIVRDLHNSFIQIFIRDGLFGSLIFILLHIKLFINLFHNINLTKNLKDIHNFYQTGLLFIFAILVNSLMQNTLEVSYKAIPYYFIWGLVGSYRLKK